jgi:thymidylate synthase
MANVGVTRPNGRQVFVPHNGIRYEYGDLMDVVEQLRKNLYTRQAVLPVFFPEDTGNINNVRVPCSLHYHFMFRQGLLHMRYDMRSCDFVRHFRDDVYLAARLLQWMGQQIEQPHGKLYVTIGSLHAMEGDRWKLEQERKNGY